MTTQSEESASPPEHEPRRRRRGGGAKDPEVPRPAEPAARAAPDGKHATEIVHHIRGRVRLRVKAAKNNPALLEEIKAVFSKVEGIERIETRDATGSVILYYDPEYHPDPATLFRNLTGSGSEPSAVPISLPHNKIEDTEQQIEQEAEYLAEHSHFARVVVEYAKQLDRELKRATDNNLDLKILAPVVLAAFTFLGIGATAATPMWVTLVIFSLNHFVELHAQDADEPQTPDG